MGGIHTDSGGVTWVESGVGFEQGDSSGEVASLMVMYYDFGRRWHLKNRIDRDSPNYGILTTDDLNKDRGLIFLFPYLRERQAPFYTQLQ